MSQQTHLFKAPPPVWGAIGREVAGPKNSHVHSTPTEEEGQSPDRNEIM
jgi:hypothetical protein